MSDGCEKLCQIVLRSALKRMKLPDSDMTANSAPAPEVFEDQTAPPPSVRTRFPVASSSTIAFLETGEFLEVND